MADAAAEVIVQIGGEDRPAGRLWSHRRRGTESATFAYDAAYLAHPDAYELDPGLPLVSSTGSTAPARAAWGT